MTRLKSVLGAVGLTAAILVTAPRTPWAAASALQGADIRFVSPREGSTVLGASVVEVSPIVPPGLRVARIEITVDDAPLATLTAPPWKTSWNAGEGDLGHRLAARMFLSDGSEARTEVRTARLHVDQTEEVALVNVYSIARDGSGRYVTDMARGDFRITENGRPQVLDRFSTERKPLRIAIVMDTSLSMKGEKLRAAKDAVLSILDVVEAGDEGIVVTFNDRVKVAQSLTSNKKALGEAIRSSEAMGGTALYDSIWESSEKLAEFDGRRVIVLLSDGRDEAASGLEPGSLHTLEEAVDRALRNEVMVFAVGLGSALARDARRLDRNPDAGVEEVDFYGRQPLVMVLRRMAMTTGGRDIFSSGPSQLKKSFQEVAEDLRHQYSMAYQSDDPSHDGTWRKIEVATTRPGVKIIHRSGYFAPRAAGPRNTRRG